MSSKGWKRYNLGEIIDDIAMGPFGSNLKVDNFIDHGVPVIRGLNLNEGGFSDEKFVFVSEEKAISLKRSLAYPDDLVFTHRGTIGQVGIIPHGEYPKYLVSQSQMRLTVNKKFLNPRYLYYFFKSPKGQYELLKNTSQVGVPAIASPTTSLKEVELTIPNLSVQNLIVGILASLDDKIELNRQTNQTLEAIAQAIYKEWFVDFRFPHSPLEGCPKGGVDSFPLEGWQVKPDGVDSFLRPCPKAMDSLQTTPASWQKNSLFPFWTLPKNRTLQERAKELRKQGILSEVVFWKTFKDKKKLGWDIDRQVIIGNFIVDFFIPELGLVFEIDGSSHNDKQEYDQERDAFLSSLQLKVVRISDKDVLRNIEGVWSFVTKSIKERVEELSPPRPSGTPQEGKNPPRQALPATPQEGNKCEMQDSKLGPIPKGWRVGKLGEIVELNPKLAIKKGSNSEYVEMKDISETSASILNHRKREFTSGSKFQNGDTLLARITPCLENGKTGFVDFLSKDEIGWGSTEFIVLRAAQSISPYFIYCLSRYEPFREFAVQSMVGSSGRQRVVESILTEFPVVIGGEEIHKKFTKLAKPIFEEIKCNSEQSATLAAIRDALLPKLMSGEIEV